MSQKELDKMDSNKINSNNLPKSEGNSAQQPDFYFNEQGLMVMTAQYHLKRGYCCKNGCKHCPYGENKK